MFQNNQSVTNTLAPSFSPPHSPLLPGDVHADRLDGAVDVGLYHRGEVFQYQLHSTTARVDIPAEMGGEGERKELYSDGMERGGGGGGKKPSANSGKKRGGG